MSVVRLFSCTGASEGGYRVYWACDDVWFEELLVVISSDFNGVSLLR